jgi:malate dehydrogenase (oxaloacetate-decarboxylating)(NADP+)
MPSKDMFSRAALDYHCLYGKAGKIEVNPTKPLANQTDLALAYTPGVAAVCHAIAKDPLAARAYTARGNLVAVITNGTAVLGLGNMGALAAKPVMEGKAVLFKKFAGIDVFDLELNAANPDLMIEMVAALEPTFGGINLEDIKAPECFYIEQQLKKRLNIPVFHDDQHGTAITVAAAILNGLELLQKNLQDVKLVTSGAGAAALACLDLLLEMGLKKENTIVTDIHGVVYQGRLEEMDERKARYAMDTSMRNLAEAIEGADVFLGLSAGNIVTENMLRKMAKRPLILALANPDPEVDPNLAKSARPDCLIATGRSDYPNQVNNALCFPFIFRGALDVGATTINEAMKLAAVYAIADLARKEPSDIVASAYGEEELTFGENYFIPKPFDPRLLITVAPAVAEAAMRSGVATCPIENLSAYRDRLTEFVYQTRMIMKPVIAAVRAQENKKVVFCEGEDERVLRAAQTIVDERIAIPILIGRPQVIEVRLKKLRLRMRPDVDFELVNPESDARYRGYWMRCHTLLQRKGVTVDLAKHLLRQNHTMIGAIMLDKEEADALICGTVGHYHTHLRTLQDIFGLKEGLKTAAAMNALLLPNQNLFLADTYVNQNPDADTIAHMTLLAAESVERFGIMPKIALLSHSNFGTSCEQSAEKMRQALTMIRNRAPHLEIDGEMHADAALIEDIRRHIVSDSPLKGAANLLIMPNRDAANIAYNLLRATHNTATVGPILLGLARPAHILTPTASVRRIVNMTAVAIADATLAKGEKPAQALTW